VLPGTGLGDEPRLPETPREERLTERVVDLVRTGMEKILALEIDARAAQPSRQVVGEVEPRGSRWKLASRFSRAYARSRTSSAGMSVSET